ncbi:FAD-binding oxidoreductase [Clostridium sp.]|uniref:FAD-binding oxidoreductase n=1 Tax=Clostridium sp. TaxID=1506 RepID=UPI001A3A2436|nr:FAD-binding oxidoreductase [Clostridium sp.]MBK5243147.1 FAD-binding oxidoreductase [Clostridium sp.]
MNIKIVESLKKIVGNDWVINDAEKISSYIKDETEHAIAPVPCYDCIVVKPANTEEISQVLKYANNESLIIIARGGGTGCAGAVVPIKPSVILSMERLNKIIEVDDNNMMVECEAGVTLMDLEERFKIHDSLFFPVHPGDEGAQVGGMVVQNAGGVRAVRYGVMRNQIKGLEVVLPTGEIIKTGGKLMKDNSGYDLTHLMIGSEGTLGIVTKAILKLYPKSSNTGSLIVSFTDKKAAVEVVPKILRKGIVPLAIEYLEKDFMLKSAKDLGLEWPAKKGIVDLYFILDEPKEDDLYETSAKIVEMCEENGAVDSLIAETAKEQRTILEIRSHGYPSIKSQVVDILDVAVPVGNITHYMNGIEELSKKYNVRMPSFGHVGDGNIHNFIMTETGEKPDCYNELSEEIYKLSIKLGGTITAEHGVGKIRNKSLHIQYSDKHLEIMRGIKNVFDPNNILNPGTGIS